MIWWYIGYAVLSIIIGLVASYVMTGYGWPKPYAAWWPEFWRNAAFGAIFWSFILVFFLFLISLGLFMPEGRNDRR